MDRRIAILNPMAQEGLRKLHLNKFEVDKGILEGALYTEETASAKVLGIQGGKCDWSRMSKEECSRK